MGETYYDVLGVPKDATDAEIREAYRERVLETHPDQNDDPDATEAFDRVRTAESVLTDDVERARYDRLGHEAYVELVEGRAVSSEASGSREPADEEGSPAAGDRSSSATDEGPSGTAGRAAGFGVEFTFDEEGTRSTADHSGPSHHARQRRRRQRATAEARTAAEWFLGEEKRRDEPADEADDVTDEESGTSEFSVHGWEGEVEWRRAYPDLEHSTWVVVCAFTVLYPVLVYSSVTSTFPLVVNAVVAACTLALVGYLLTIPHVAVYSFGVWSVLAPVGLLALTDLEVLSVPFLGLAGAFWVPFGYAVVVRWALER